MRFDMRCNMKFCTPECRKWTAVGFSISFLVIGFVLIFCWSNFFNSMMSEQLSLANKDTMQYKEWIETPIDIMLEAYLFHWSNSEDFENGAKWTKPIFEQKGPYTFAERHSRSNVVFNDNYTISFNTIRRWRFVPERTNGSLDDLITIINPVAIAVAKIVKDKHYLIQRGVHYVFKEKNVTLAQAKTVRELMFDGFSDPLIDLASKLRIRGFEIPWDRFGYFYPRNGSATYDGNYTMYTGEDDSSKTGIVTEWNGKNHSDAYPGECSRIDGSTGEVFNPVKDAETASMFLTDVCSKLTLERQGSYVSKGIRGNFYVSTDKLFDNGLKYPDTACFSPENRMPSGVRDISECKYKAPAYISLPHFNLADKWYRESVGGMHPDPEKHRFSLVIQPDLGIPLEAQANFQANFLLYNVKGIDIFKNVKETMIPMMFVEVEAGVPDEYVFMLKMAIAAPAIGTILGYVLVLMAIGLFVFVGYYETKKRREMRSFLHNE